MSTNIDIDVNLDTENYKRCISLYKLGILNDQNIDNNIYIDMFKIFEKHFSDLKTFKNVNNNNQAYGIDCTNILISLDNRTNNILLDTHKVLEVKSLINNKHQGLLVLKIMEEYIYMKFKINRNIYKSIILTNLNSGWSSEYRYVRT